MYLHKSKLQCEMLHPRVAFLQLTCTYRNNANPVILLREGLELCHRQENRHWSGEIYETS